MLGQEDEQNRVLNILSVFFHETEDTRQANL